MVRPRIVETLRLAREFRRRLDDGEVRNQAELGMREGITRGRVTQVLNLLRLHPAIRAYVNSLAAGSRALNVTERMLRPLGGMREQQQLELACELLDGFAGFLREHGPQRASSFGARV